MGLRARILLSLGFLMAVSVLLMTFIVPRIHERQLSSLHREKASLVTRTLATALAQSPDPESLLASVRTALPEFRFATTAFHGPLQVSAEIRDLDDGIELTRPVLPKNGRPSILTVTAPFTRIREASEMSARLVVFYLAFNSVVLFLFGAIWLTRSVVRPLHALIRTTERLANDETGAPPPLFSGGTEIERLSNAYAQMLAALKERRARLVEAEQLATVGRFASAIAHEVGNPLAAVLGFVDIVRQPGRDEQERAEILGRVSAELHRIDRFLHELLDFARPVEVTLSSVDVTTPIRDALSVFEAQGRLSRVEVIRDFASDLPLVRANPERLRQVFVNLISNALDATAALEIVRTLILRAERRGDRVVIEVADNGPGIADDVRPRIFEPFVSTKGSGHGTGLGLAVAKSIVRSIGGTIEATNAPGGGALFRVALSVV